MRRPGKLPRRVYFCKVCDAWHLTHVPHFDVINELSLKDNTKSLEMEENKTLSDEKLVHECRKRVNRLRGDVGVLRDLIDRFEQRFGFEDDENEGFTADDLKRIAEWPHDDFQGLVAFVEDIWWMPEWGFLKDDMPGGFSLELHTGGWSGNEQIVEALKRNRMFWAMCWVKSERGGHYWFKIESPGRFSH